MPKPVKNGTCQNLSQQYITKILGENDQIQSLAKIISVLPIYQNY